MSCDNVCQAEQAGDAQQTQFIHIIAGVFGSFGGLIIFGILFAVCCAKRRRRLVLQQRLGTDIAIVQPVPYPQPIVINQTQPTQQYYDQYGQPIQQPIFTQPPVYTPPPQYQAIPIYQQQQPIYATQQYQTQTQYQQLQTNAPPVYSEPVIVKPSSSASAPSENIYG